MTDLVTIQIVKGIEFAEYAAQWYRDKENCLFLSLECACNADVTLQDNVTLVALFSLFQLLFPPPSDSI